MNLQAHYELETARDELGEQVAQEVTPYVYNGQQVAIRQAA